MYAQEFARFIAAVSIAAAALLPAGGALAQQAVSLQLAVKNHRFEPAEIHAAANRPIVLGIRIAKERANQIVHRRGHRVHDLAARRARKMTLGEFGTNRIEVCSRDRARLLAGDELREQRVLAAR